MPRKLLKRYLPDAAKLRKRRELRFLGRMLDDPFLLHLNRRSVAGGLAVGLFWALIPLPFQMVISAATAMVLRVNLVIAVAAVWVSNPVTMAPIMFFCYRLGQRILGHPVRETTFTPSIEWFWSQLGHIWLPLYFGSLIMAITVALTGFVGAHLLWRLQIVRALKQRKLKALLRRDTDDR